MVVNSGSVIGGRDTQQRCEEGGCGGVRGEELWMGVDLAYHLVTGGGDVLNGGGGSGVEAIQGCGGKVRWSGKVKIRALVAIISQLEVIASEIRNAPRNVKIGETQYVPIAADYADGLEGTLLDMADKLATLLPDEEVGMEKGR